jgi:transposase
VSERVAIPIHIPGLNIFGTLLIVTEIGQMTRFANAKKLGGYAGLVRSTPRSGQTDTNVPITKAGASPMLWGMSEAGHPAVRDDAQRARFFPRLEERKGSTVAVVVPAGQILVIN